MSILRIINMLSNPTNMNGSVKDKFNVVSETKRARKYISVFVSKS